MHLVYARIISQIDVQMIEIIIFRNFKKVCPGIKILM